MSDINITVNDEIVNIDVLDTPVLVNVVNSPGQQGPAGPGVPVGGTAGQVLAKNSSTNYDTVWVNQSGGVPYSGATGNVNIGEYELKAGQVTLDTSPTGTAAVGTIRWNDTTGTSETTLKGGNVIIKNGVDLVARVVNKVSPNTTLTKAAYQAVRVSGAQGQRLAIELAQANNDAGSADTIGLVTETIAPNQEGFIMTVGQLEGINTTGSLQGETWVDGDVLYLSPTTAGAITNVKPTGATGHLVIIGYVEYAHANNGKLYIKVANGFELDELHNVSIVTPTNNQGLFYNSSNSLWENKTIATVLGYTPEQPLTFNSPLSRAGNVVSIPQATGSVNGFLSATDWTTFNSKQAALGFTPANAATTLTINGVTFDLSANRSWTIAAGISGSGAAGQVTYWDGTSSVSGSNNLFWDAANNRLGIGNNVPAFNLSIKSSTSVSTIHNQNNSIGGQYFITAGPDSSYMTAGASFNGTNWVAQYTMAVLFGTFAGDVRIYANKSLTSGNIFTPSERFTIFGSTGNVAVNSTTDLSVRFGVVGDTLLRGSGNTSATTALTVQNSDSTTLFSIDNGGTLMNLPAAMTIRPFSSAGVLSFAGSGNRRYDFGSSETNTSTTAVTQTFITISRGFNPTSGTSLHTSLLISPLINQTGGANGVTRGLYVNPTLTAAADWRSIEWSNNSGWGLYGAGTAPNYLVGNLLIGSTNNFAKLYVAGPNVSGTTQTYIGSQPTINQSLTNLQCFWSNIVGNLASTVTNAYSYIASQSGIASSTITNLFGFTADSSLSTATNVYGFYGNIASGTGRWNLYMNGTADNYIAGRLGIGTTSLSAVNLAVYRNITGSIFSVSISSQGLVQSDVTNTAFGYYAATGTQATTFTLQSLVQYQSDAGSFGAGSTITDHVGFRAANIPAANVTNAFAFQGGMASGTGRWNLYMVGTANNYVAGNFSVGTTSVTNWVNIAASTTAKAHINLAAGSTPTAPANGDIWFDGTDIKMRIGGVTKTFTLI